MQFERASRGGRLRRLEKFARGFRRPARVRERVPQTYFKIEQVRRIRLQFYRAPEVKRRPVEGERAGGFAGSGFGVSGGAIVFAGPEIVLV